MVEKITAYKTTDNKLFEDENKANKRQDEINTKKDVTDFIHCHAFRWDKKYDFWL